MKRAVKLCLIYSAFAAMAALIYAAVQYTEFHFLCPFNELTGFRCPACGNTRVLFSVLRGDFKAAFSQNMMFLPEAAALIFALLYYPYAAVYKRQVPRAVNIFLAVLITVFVLWGFIRNIFSI